MTTTPIHILRRESYTKTTGGWFSPSPIPLPASPLKGEESRKFLPLKFPPLQGEGMGEIMSGQTNKKTSSGKLQGEIKDLVESPLLPFLDPQRGNIRSESFWEDPSER